MSAPPKKTGKKKGASIFDKLTDASQYTGAHKQRFDKDGRGRGKEGRTDNTGGIKDISEIMRPALRGEKEKVPTTKATLGSDGPKKRVAKKKGPSIFDKLTDTSQYTGAHKERFDKSGKGRGKEGRTDNTGGIKDISEIMRPALRGEKEKVPTTKATLGSDEAKTKKKVTKKKGASIFDKLTDTKQYTGAHKERFDKSGKGRGKEGRTDADTSDLSKLTRSNLNVSGGGMKG